MMIEARTRLTETARNQAQGMESEKPTRIFLDNLAELLNSKQVALKDLTNPDAKDPPPTEKMVGYMDNEYYYLLPNVAFANVARLCREQGQEFPVSLKALYKHLRTDGILRGLGKDENPTRLKWINERPKRVLWIPAELMIGPKANAQQMTMTQVGNEVLPEEFK